jgi:hypothetical protein
MKNDLEEERGTPCAVFGTNRTSLALFARTSGACLLPNAMERLLDT